ncbi:Hypothetical protein POVR1_LOCUS302 [uncultured virus]|nr:Hypothetical protein POVR1_LOCUS302 [uncultured virus]
MDELRTEWADLMMMPVDEVLPSNEWLNDFSIIFNLIPVEEMIDFVLRRNTREDYRDWMPCRISMVGTLMRCRYINVNPKSPVYHHTLYLNVQIDGNGFDGQLQEFNLLDEISCVSVKIP